MPFRCDECGLVFSWRNMQKHQQQHENGLFDRRDNSAENQPSSQTQDQGVANNPTEPQKGYVCVECGKVYTYLVSFKKHLQEHRKSRDDPKRHQALAQYSCPYCGVVFARMSKLQAHMRSHNTRDPRCDQCDKTFYTTKTYLSHVELHQQNPLWCLSCCRGFKDEASIHLHLQRHQLGKHKCCLCSKQFLSEVLLKRHYKTSHPTYAAAPNSHGDEQESSRTPPENEATDASPPRTEDEPEIDALDCVKCDELEDYLEVEDSDCGEPAHRKTPGDPSHQSDSKKQHSYWEWECVECDAGFDDVSMLHHHYMQHATGEIPMQTDAA